MVVIADLACGATEPMHLLYCTKRLFLKVTTQSAWRSQRGVDGCNDAQQVQIDWINIPLGTARRTAAIEASPISASLF